jgi:hypothetical protein
MRAFPTTFRTHKLVEVDPDRLAFRTTKGALFFTSEVLLPGVVVFYLVLKGVVPGLSTGNMSLNGFLALSVSLLFLSVGGGLLYFWTIPVVFDRRRGFFWKGWKAPDEGFDGPPLGNAANLRAIHALQLIPNEINLVMVDGERLYVVGYTKISRKRIREDAAVLARFLGKPAWDGL